MKQFAVYEKEPAHGKDRDGIILAPFNSKKEAEDAGKKYGYHGENYYVAPCFDLKVGTEVLLPLNETGIIVSINTKTLDWFPFKVKIRKGVFNKKKPNTGI